MKQKVRTKSKETALRLTLIGASAGFVNGLIGAGGGIIIVFGMMPLIVSKEGSARDAFANALAVMLPVSLISVISYLISGRFENTKLGIYIIPAAIGGVIGAYVLDRINVTLLKKMFAAIVIWSGIYMILR